MHGTKRVNAERTRQALELDPEVIAVACPFCMTMIEDGVKSVSKEEQVKVLDLAEVIASALPPAAEKPAPRAEA
jgi:heterodisulfide reductase subunit D